MSDAETVPREGFQENTKMPRTIYYIDFDREKRNTAGAKAPDDIAEICRRAGYTKYTVPAYPKDKNKIYRKLWLLFGCTRWWRKLGRLLQDGDIVIYQHPLYGHRVTGRMVEKIHKKTRCSFFVFIHDLESLRGGVAGVVSANAATSQYSDNDMLMKFDAVICHNKRMHAYLVSRGYEENKLIDLEIFDYLTDAELKKQEKGDAPSIAIAGNLAIGKCPYIYSMFDAGHNAGLTVNLYGIGFQEDKASSNMIYHGSFKPEELPGHLKGDFGLVWDGTSAETCAGNTGEYLRYNNPHKTSLYLASGMPVVCWSQAAIADFVLENGVGITVDSLYQLEERIKNVTAEEYKQLADNAAKMAEKLRSGFYTLQAIERSAEKD